MNNRMAAAKIQAAETDGVILGDREMKIVGLIAENSKRILAAILLLCLMGCQSVPLPPVRGSWKTIHSAFAYEEDLFLQSGESCGSVVVMRARPDIFVSFHRGGLGHEWNALATAKADVERYCGVQP